MKKAAGSKAGIKASKVMKKASGSKASQNMKKPAASRNPQVEDEIWCTDSESEHEQFRPGYVGRWKYIGSRGATWATVDTQQPGRHRRFFQTAPAALPDPRG